MKFMVRGWTSTHTPNFSQISCDLEKENINHHDCYRYSSCARRTGIQVARKRVWSFICCDVRSRLTGSRVVFITILRRSTSTIPVLVASWMQRPRVGGVKSPKRVNSDKKTKHEVGVPRTIDGGIGACPAASASALSSFCASNSTLFCSSRCSSHTASSEGGSPCSALHLQGTDPMITDGCGHRCRRTLGGDFHLSCRGFDDHPTGGEFRKPTTIIIINAIFCDNIRNSHYLRSKPRRVSRRTEGENKASREKLGVMISLQKPSFMAVFYIHYSR